MRLAGKAKEGNVLRRRLAEPGGDRQRHSAGRQPEAVHDDHRQTRQGESVEEPDGVTADVQREKAQRHVARGAASEDLARLEEDGERAPDPVDGGHDAKDLRVIEHEGRRRGGR